MSETEERERNKKHTTRNVIDIGNNVQTIMKFKTSFLLSHSVQRGCDGVNVHTLITSFDDQFHSNAITLILERSSMNYSRDVNGVCSEFCLSLNKSIIDQRLFFLVVHLNEQLVAAAAVGFFFLTCSLSCVIVYFTHKNESLDKLDEQMAGSHSSR